MTCYSPVRGSPGDPWGAYGARKLSACGVSCRILASAGSSRDSARLAVRLDQAAVRAGRGRRGILEPSCPASKVTAQPGHGLWPERSGNRWVPLLTGVCRYALTTRHPSAARLLMARSRLSAAAALLAATPAALSSVQAAAARTPLPREPETSKVPSPVRGAATAPVSSHPGSINATVAFHLVGQTWRTLAATACSRTASSAWTTTAQSSARTCQSVASWRNPALPAGWLLRDRPGNYRRHPAAYRPPANAGSCP